ncbi:GGDEF domain-containing protein [Saccharopolyspora shandongensis]|uniref:GGDEF domain-containing protein n=1 Tax=Saccharopolyspora shandongensis TaxID=418495 RepID=UPI0034405F8D
MFAKPAAVVGVLGTAITAGYAWTLHRHLHTDPLTGLANRAALHTAFARAQRRARPGELIGVLMCDVDGFKAVNDTHGHRTGDLLLQSIATDLARIAGPGELPVRLAGDEFAVLLTRLPEVRAAESRARAYRTALAAERGVGDLRLRLRVSVGPAVDTARDTTLSALLGHADARMYALKQQHRITTLPATPEYPTARLRDHRREEAA